jgi:hypothetical protein
MEFDYIGSFFFPVCSNGIIKVGRRIKELGLQFWPADYYQPENLLVLFMICIVSPISLSPS